VTFALAMVMSAIWEGGIASWVRCILGALFAVVAGWALRVWQRLYGFFHLARAIFNLGYFRRGFFGGVLR